MREKIMTVAYRVVHGNAKNYSYWGAKYYRLRSRKRDGIYTWRPISEYGLDFRSYRLAMVVAKSWAKKKKIAFCEGIRLGIKLDL